MKKWKVGKHNFIGAKPCSLQGSKDDEKYRYVKMHGLIRDMVQAGAQLTELPDVRWWREDLSRVSLMENRIKDRSTLLLCRNYELKLVEFLHSSLFSSNSKDW